MLKKEQLVKYVFNLNFIAAVYLICVVVVSVQTILLGESSNGYTHYNNYVIFKQSFFHLLESENLYARFPEQHWDHFKYSPTFALLFIFGVLPDILGVFIWGLINCFTLFFAIKALPVKNDIKVCTLWFILIELITSLQNDQSNALIAGLLIYSFIFLCRQSELKSTFCIVAVGFIKIFGLAGFIFFLFSNKKLKYFLTSFGWIILLFFLPLLVISFDELIWQYENWGKLLENDHGASYSYGQSVMGILLIWFDYDAPKIGVLIVGLFLLGMQFIHISLYKDRAFQYLILCSILIWVIIFNHKAESATFIIAVSGMALWFFSQQKNNINLALIIMAFLFTVLSATDFYPKYLRINYFKPYLIKVVPCILIWIKLTYDLIFQKYKFQEDAIH